MPINSNSTTTVINLVPVPALITTWRNFAPPPSDGDGLFGILRSEACFRLGRAEAQHSTLLPRLRFRPDGTQSEIGRSVFIAVTGPDKQLMTGATGR